MVNIEYDYEVKTAKDLIDFSRLIIDHHNDDYHLKNKWIENFCLMDISDSEKVDVLISSKPLFENYTDFDNETNRKHEIFVNLINSDKYIYAVRLSKLLANRFPQSREKIRKIVKDKELNFIFADLDMKLGGTGVAVIKKANSLVKRGYKVNLLSTNEIQDYDAVRSYFYNQKGISQQVKFINIFEYYSKKNSTSDRIKKHVIDEANFIVKEVETNHSYRHFDFFDNSDSNNPAKTEILVNETLVLRISYEPFKKEYFTSDFFNYLTVLNDEYILNNVHHSNSIKFSTFNQFISHFVNEFCDIVNQNPFLIVDDTFSSISIEDVNPRESMKIGSLHGNPFFKGGNPDIGNNRKINKKISHFHYLDELDALVVLTDYMKEDLIKEKYYERYVVIPNFITDDRLDYEPIKKDVNKIAIFSRVAKGKNLSDAIKAFKIVAMHNDKAKLEIFGRDDYNEKARLELLVKELELEDRIFFKGFIKDANLEMRNSLCTLMTSFYEGLSLALLESMANGTPVITYNINYGTEEVITNNVDGMVVEFGDYEAMAKNILSLLDNPQKAIDMGVKAKEKIVNDFSETSVCDKWEDLFIDVYVKNEIANYELSLKEQGYIDLLKSNENLQKKYENLTKENKKLKNVNKKIKKENKELSNLNNQILNSKSWNVTKPLRKFRYKLPFNK